MKGSKEKYCDFLENFSEAAFITDAGTGLIVGINILGMVLLGRHRDEIMDVPLM